jgi:hypothetical protein
MLRLEVRKAATLLGLVGIAVASSAYASFTCLDTISSNTANYQIGGQISKALQLGFDAGPYSGDFTGVRPYNPTSYPAEPPYYPALTNAYGTSGVLPFAQLFDATDQPFSGNYASWLAQPFVAPSNGTVTSVSFIAQWKPTATYNQGTGRTAYAAVIPAPAGGQITSAVWGAAAPYGTVDLTNATLGSQVTANGLSAPILSGQTYWVVIAPSSTYGLQGTYTGLDYADVNWAWRSNLTITGTTTDALYNNENGVGSWVDVPNAALGVTVTASSAPTTGGITGKIGLQFYPNNLYTSIPVTFTLVSTGTTVLTTNLDSAGNFTLTGIQPGTYRVGAKAFHWLRAIHSGVTVVAGSNTNWGTATLLNGDINNDNFVEDQDYSLLGAAWYSQVGDGNYNINADLNGDGFVEDQDYSILGTNWYVEGDEFN